MENKQQKCSLSNNKGKPCGNPGIHIIDKLIYCTFHKNFINNPKKKEIKIPCDIISSKNKRQCQNPAIKKINDLNYCSAHFDIEFKKGIVNDFIELFPKEIPIKNENGCSELTTKNIFCKKDIYAQINDKYYCKTHYDMLLKKEKISTENIIYVKKNENVHFAMKEQVGSGCIVLNREKKPCGRSVNYNHEGNNYCSIHYKKCVDEKLIVYDKNHEITKPNNKKKNKNTVEKDTIEKDTAKKDTIEKDIVKKNTVKKDTIEKDIVKKDTAKKDTVNVCTEESFICSSNDCDTCSKKSFKLHPMAKHLSDKNAISVDVICRTSKIMLSFLCKDCGHEFTNTADNIIKRNQGCFYCGKRKKCLVKTCEFCYPDISDDTTEGDRVKLSEIKKYLIDDSDILGLNRFSKKKLKFYCSKCDHTFNRSLHEIKKFICPYCRHGSKTKLCDKKECKFCFDKSLASLPNINMYWSSKNEMEPRFIKKGVENKKYWFKCDVCKHEVERFPKNVTKSDSCAFCISKSELCDDNACQSCFEKSFASHPKAKYWSSKNEKTPRQVYKGNNNKYYFNCDRCNTEFKIKPNHIVYCSSWCSLCTNKTEQKLKTWLEKYYSIRYQPRYPWCKKENKKGRKKELPFDFSIKNRYIIIELDGRQHFESISYWKSNHEKQQIIDLFKMKCALKNGYRFIRLLQTDVWYDQNNWKLRLKEAIEKKDKLICLSSSKNEYSIYNDLLSVINKDDFCEDDVDNVNICYEKLNSKQEESDEEIIEDEEKSNEDEEKESNEGGEGIIEDEEESNEDEEINEN